MLNRSVFTLKMFYTIILSLAQSYRYYYQNSIELWEYYIEFHEKYALNWIPLVAHNFRNGTLDWLSRKLSWCRQSVSLTAIPIETKVCQYNPFPKCIYIARKAIIASSIECEKQFYWQQPVEFYAHPNE